MKFESWDRSREIELNDCPFCGGKPKVQHIGNEQTKSRKVRIICTGCRVQRTDAAIYKNFAWVEDTAAKNWNQMPRETI